MSNMCAALSQIDSPGRILSRLGVTRAETQMEPTVLFCHTLELR